MISNEIYVPGYANARNSSYIQVPNLINYNNEYCLFNSSKITILKSLNSTYYHYNRAVYQSLEQSMYERFPSLNTSLIRSFTWAFCRHTINTNPNIVTVDHVLLNPDFKNLFKLLVNECITPTEYLNIFYQGSSLSDVIAYFNHGLTYIVRTRAGRYVSGGGILGIYNYSNHSINPLVALVVKTEYAQVPKLHGILDEPITENKDNMFALYVQGGFDYKETPYKNLRSLYRKHIIPWAKANNIPIITKSNLAEELFLIPKSSIFGSVREEQQFYQSIYNDIKQSVTHQIETETEILW